jgi:predicted signal transduction protein with EAL and GGDEF domain
VIAAEERNEESSGIATLARLGGDEFTVLLEEVPNARVALDLAERMQDALRQPMLLEGQEVYSSASFGIASSETDYDSVADIMRDADLAMYRAKAEGRSRVEVFDKSMHHTAVQRLALESDLRGALMRNEFVLHYQPIFSLESGELAGFEALLRWQRGKTTLVMPGDFVDIAEETGLIVYIGNWVLREACRTAALWHRQHPRPKPLTMSINVSLRQFHQPDFVSSTISAINESGVDPHAIRLEVTESVTIRDAERTIEILRKLREFGVGISIDDFGTGYSSLSYLHQLPFDTLKIDRSFVKALQQRSEGREIIQTILDLARNLKMNVVAEGTETAAHVDQLREMGCHFAQGFFFSHPLDTEAATRLLDAPSPMRRQA